jgi:transposase
VRAFILWQRRPLPARSLTPFFYPRTGSKRVWRASLDRRRGIGEAGASSTCPAVGFGLTDDAASQASRCSARRLLNNLRQVSNKSSCSSTATTITLTADPSRRWRASGLASLRCVFVQDASQHLPKVKTADLASGTLFGSSVGTDNPYDFER